MEKEQAMVALGFHGVELNDSDRYGVEVLTAILGSSFNGRLFSKIRQELGHAYSLGGSSIPSRNTGFIYFYVLTSPDSFKKVREVLNNEIKRIQAEDITDKELTDIKMYLKGNFLAGLETNSVLSFVSSMDELYSLGFDNYLKYTENIDKVSKEDIKRLAIKYLDLMKSVQIITLPENMKSENLL